ncbi:hypothetical protein WMY93_024807 [Mugilogobius chulae]|uniref:Uncharacterized protein n=1 Tax=Mugilogobius chulae TaxID=88201 RepID=A0AAW0N547_9GOBI
MHLRRHLEEVQSQRSSEGLHVVPYGGTSNGDKAFSSEEEKTHWLKMQYIIGRRRGQWRRRVKQSGWKDGRAQGTSVRRGGEAMNPEQVNTAADRHGLSGCLPPVAQRCIHSPKETTEASQDSGRVGRLGQPCPDRGR